MLLAKGWNIIKFLSSIKEQMGSAATWIVAIIGMIMFIVGIWLIAKGLMSQGRGQTNWVLAIVLLVLGALLGFGAGMALLTDFSNDTASVVNDLGK